MPTYISLILVSIAIGMLVGGVGSGGFFMPTALVLIADISLHQGMATSLFALIFMGMVGAIYFHKQGSVHWALVRPVCIGAVFTGFAGAWLGAQLSSAILTLVMVAIIMMAGIYILASDSDNAVNRLPADPKQQWIILASIGAVTGFLSGLAGIGGPALSVPLMMLFGFPLLTSLGTGQVLQIVGALSGTIANLKLGAIDFGLAMFIAAFEICGVMLGAYLVHRIDIGLVKKFIGVLCLLTGCAFLLRTL